MRSLRLLFGMVLATALGMGGYAFVTRGPTSDPLITAHIPDRRYRGGCTDSALLRVLPGGVSPGQICTGTLSGSRGETITTTRASNKTCTLADGGLVYLSSNQPAVEAQGLLSEGASTNLAAQSAAFEHTPTWTGIGGTPPTMTADMAVAPDGTTTADLMSLPAVSGVGNFSDINQSMVTTNAVHTASVWAKGQSGSGTFYIAILDGTSSAWTSSACSYTATAWKRCSVTSGAALTAGSNFFVMGVDLRTGSGQSSQSAQTVLLWGGQFEAFAFASSYIPTTTTSATRAADVISISKSYVLGDHPSFSMDASTYDPNYGAPGNPQTFLTQGTGDRWGMLLLAGGSSDFDYNNGTEFNSIQSGLSVGVNAHLVGYYDGTNLVAGVNGTFTASARSFSGTTTQNILYLGRSAVSNANLNGHLANFCMAADKTVCR